MLVIGDREPEHGRRAYDIHNVANYHDLCRPVSTMMGTRDTEAENLFEFQTIKPPFSVGELHVVCKVCGLQHLIDVDGKRRDASSINLATDER